MSMGISIGFSTILIPELYKENAEIVVTIGELTWIGSINYIAVTIGAIFSGFIAEWLGRRTTIMILTLSYTVAWTILYYTKEIKMLFVALTMSGLTGGFAESPLQTYAAEISEPSLRGGLSTTVSMTLTIGVFLQFLIGSYVYWRTLVLINLVFPAVCFLAMCFIPESPHWLASRSRFNECKRSLIWLRGWTDSTDVQREYESLFQLHHKTTITRQRSRIQNIKQMVRVYLQKKVYLPFMMVSFTFFVSCFNGSAPILTYAVLLFQKLDSPVNEYTATMILGLLKVIGGIITIVLIHYTGKRKLTFYSLIGAGLALGIVTIYCFLQNYHDIDVKQYSWIPTVMILVSVFSCTVGIKNIPWIMSGEVFPQNIRSIANGLVSSTFNIYSAMINKVFLYMVQSMTLAGTFLFFTLINFFGLIVLYFILPETEGRTLQEIEQHYAGVRNLKDRPIIIRNGTSKSDSYSTVPCSINS
ncbi:facilitated trehalose transporter Tret1-like isoform X2 [Phymastichus coffea]|nr:facilitated trehalose transporter Tret1-like isoform X2 [Phymastichus coffea]XP_058790661.1 facilitated trehalose transporter Tret1-like isoform X2 [Phymastichus coffea]XP_058790662.1 facilitated trehalose transporter Tret1-like isoform X2 [Phymastichus coffea]